MKPILSWLLPMVATFLVWPTIAHADCTSETPRLLWSIPADGDTAVPTNPRLFAIAIELEAIYLDEELVVGDTGKSVVEGVVLPELEPNTTHTLTFTFREVDGNEAPPPIIHTFTTGAGPLLTPPPVPVIRDMFGTDVDAPDVATPTTYAYAGYCLDDGSPGLLEVEATADAPVYQLEIVGERQSQGSIWPASLGLPAWFRGSHCALSDRVDCLDDPTNPENDQDTCFVLAAIGPSGLVSRSQPYCPGIPSAANDEGCTIIAPHAPTPPLRSLSALLVAGLFVTLRLCQRGQ